MSDEKKTGSELFDQYVEGELHIKIDSGDIVIKPTPRDKMAYLRLQATKNVDVEAALKVITDIVQRAYPDVPREKLENMVIMEQNAIARELLPYFKLMTKEQYDERTARAMGVPVKKNDEGVVPQTHNDEAGNSR